MPDADERLRLALRTAAPVPVDDDIRSSIAGRRRARERRRRFFSGVLAVVVVAGSVGGFLGLRRVFRVDEPTPRTDIGAVANGSIVYSGLQDQGLFLVDPTDGSTERLTSDDDLHASWSPDGSHLVFVRRSAVDRSIRLHVLDLASRGTIPITPPDMSVYRPAWSPDGRWIAFDGFGGDPDGEQEPVPSGIYLVRPDGSQLHRITDDRFASPDMPTWSPDGRSLVFASNLKDGADGYRPGWDLFRIERDGSGLTNVTRTADPGSSEFPIGWLENGNLLIAVSPDVVRSGQDQPSQTGAWLEITTNGDTVRTVLEEEVNSPRHLQEPSLSPDRRSVVYDSASAGGRQNVWTLDLTTLQRRQVTTDGGFLAAWQPVPIAAARPPSPTSATDRSPVLDEPQGVDVGLETRLCDVQRLGGIEFFADGPRGVAWTGSPVKTNGRCPRAFDAPHIVAVDVDGDGSADSWTDLPVCTGCEPYDATDLGGDGTKELLVLLQSGSTPEYAIYDVVPTGFPRAAGVYPIVVDTPAAPAAGLRPGEIARFWAGGDEGFSAAIACERYPSAPILVVTWSLFSVPEAEGDPTATEEFHLTRLRLVEDPSSASFEVVSTSSEDRPIDAELPFEQPDRACGVDWTL
jgi:Tol biopolymer transport system component